MTQRRIEITLERQKVLVIRGRRSMVIAWCSECAGQVNMITPDEAAVLTCINSRAIYRRVEAEELHFTETPEGLLFICLNSLLK